MAVTFRMNARRRATMPISATLVAEDGRAAAFRGQVTFQILSKDELEEITGLKLPDNATMADRIIAAAQARNSDVEVLRRTVVGWDLPQYVDDDGKPVPFSAAALEALVQDLAPVVNAMAAAYAEAHHGKGRAKN